MPTELLPGGVPPPSDALASFNLPTPKKILPGAQEKLEAAGIKRLLPGAGKPINPNAQALLEATGTKRIKPEPPEPGFEGLEEVHMGGDVEPGFEGLQEVDPGFEGLPEAEKLDYATPKELLDDDTFRPAQYIAENPDVTKDGVKFQKLLDVYRAKRERGLETGKVLKTAVKEAPGIVGKTILGARDLAERVLDVGVQPGANALLGVLTGQSPEEMAGIQAEAGKQQLKAAGEVTAGTEQAIVGLTQLGQQGARKLFGKKVSELNDNELYDQLLLDAEFHKATQDIAQGKGEANKLAGLDADFLQKNGVTLDQDAISNLSLVDPVTLVATGGVFKVVGVGGKILATAATRAGAQAVVNGLQKVAANSVRVAGRAAELAGKGVQRLPLRTPSIAATGAQLASGNVLGAIGAAAAPPAIRAGGRALEVAGRTVAELGEQAVPGFTGPQTAGMARLSKLAASPAGQIAKGGAQGALVGSITAAPLAAAADESETAGAILGGGAGLGAVAGLALAGKQQVARAVAKHYLDPSTIPFDPVDSPGYGIDGNLDRTHEAAIGQLSESERNAVNNFREALRDAGGEIYVQDQASYLERVRESLQSQNGGKPLTPAQEALAKTYADTHAVFDTYLTDANGVQRRAVFLNSTAKGLPHDAGHLFQSLLNPERQAQLRKAVFDAYSKEQIAEFADAYAQRLEKPDYFSKLGEEAGRDKIADELIAENFSQIFGNAKLSDLKAPPKFLETLGRTAAEAGEALGLDLTDNRTTPDLAAKPSFRLQNILRNASREVLNLPKAEPKAPFPQQGERALPEAEPKPTEAPKAADIAPVTPEAVTPEAVKPESVTPEAAPTPEVKPPVVDETAKRSQERGIDVARELTKDQPEAAAVVETVAKSMDEGNPVLRIEHRGITQEPGAPRETARQPRRGTQEAGYQALEALQIENRKEAPPEVVSVHEKTFVPVRFVEQGGKATLIAMSMDKVISNLRKVIADAAGKASDLIPYQQENGKLTEAGWNDALADLRAYAENQSHGYRGDGQKLVRPDEGAGLSIPAEDPNFVPTILDEAKANFANLVQGIAPPLTARQVGKQVPGNVKGQILAELQGRTPEKPAVIRPSDIQKQSFKKPFEGREVKETNPLRNELARRGVKVRDLTEVTERLAAEDIASVERSAGPQQAAPVTDVIRGGFLPKELPDAINAVETATADNWQSLWGPEGSLTKSAFRTGLDLTHPDQLVALKEAQGRMSDLTKLQLEKAKQTLDLDLMQEASRTAMKGQFFREAYEAATDTGSAGNQQGGWRRYFPDEQAPFANRRDFLVRTDKGREAEQKGYDIAVTGTPGRRAAVIKKDGVVVGEIASNTLSTDKGRAIVNSASIQKAHRGRGLAEAAYRELLTALKEDGVTNVEGTVVAEQPLHIRRKIFGDENTKVTDERGEVPIDQALSEFDEGSLGFNVENQIKPEMSFLPAQEAGAETGKQREAREAWVKQGTKSPFFQRWFKGSQVVDPARPSDPQTVYHGTTHEFTRFENRGANPENDFGEGFYFSSDPQEVGRNYAGEGPDLTQRIEQRAELLEISEGLSRDEAMQRAREEIKGAHGGAMMPVYLNLKKPFRLGDLISGTPETTLEMNPRTGKGTLSKFLDNLVEEANRAYDTKPEELRQEVLEAANYDSISASDLIKTLRNSENLIYAADEAGNQVVNELIRRALEKSGFDGVIDETVSVKFKHMGLAPDTIHYIAFKPEQVKSATGNVGTFKKAEADIRFLPSDKQVTDALSSDKKEFVGAHRGLKPGTRVGLRIDIPAYNRSGVYVQTIHEKASGGAVGKRIGYDSVATVDNPTFFSNETGAEKIRAGAAKFPIATVEGEFNPSREVPTDLEGWTQVGYNPTKHSYFYEKGTEKPVVSGSQAVSAGNTVYVKDPVYGNKADFKFLPKEVAPESQEGPVPVTEGGRSFLPKPGTPEYDAYVDGRIEESKRFPEAIPLEANKDPKTGHYKSEYKDEPNWVRTPYDFSNSPLAKLHKVEGDAVASENGYTDALGKKIEEAYHEAKKNPAVEAGETWYSTARDKIKTLLGEDAQLFAELLGATSPNTSVDTNFGYSVEAYNLFKQGYYDKILEKYREGRTKYEAGEIEDFTNETGKTGKQATEKAFLTWWADKHNLEVRSNRQKPDGEYIKFGMHTPQVLRVFDRSWLRGVEGPKTPNFAGNLSGGTFEATIDKWAARLVRRLSHEGMTDKPWRILPPAETGVSDPNFFTAQKAFRKAGDKLGVQPDALQAILWFFEKNLWEEKGWDVSAAGTAKADYNALLKRTEKTPTGQLKFTKPEKPPKEKKPKKPPKEKKPKKAPTAEEITGERSIDKGVSAGDID